jgi:peptidoglycan hydrolase-like protein with peptidoglycan-binding domain
MSESGSIDTMTAKSRLREFRQLYLQLHREFIEDGVFDPEEAAVLKEVEELIGQAENQLRRGQALVSEEDGGPVSTEDPANPHTQARIGGSVGQGGKNAEEDVTTVQELLNQNGASPALEVDGQCGPRTVRAIAGFQQAALGFSDGRIDVDGQTWSALSGAATGVGPSGSEGGSQPLPQTPDPAPPGTLPAEEDRVPADPPATGAPPIFQETFVTAGPFTFKTQFDENGKVIGCEAEAVDGNLSLSIPVGLYTLSGGFQLLEVATTILNQKGAIVTVTMKVSLKGFGAVEFGVTGIKAIYELSLEAYSEARQILIDTEDPQASTSNVPNPTQLIVKGTGECKVSLGEGVESGGTVMKGEYDKLLIVTIHDGPSVTVERGPGVDKFNDDVIAALELARKNPQIVGTGGAGGWRPGDPPETLKPGREELEADAMQHIADDAQLIMVQSMEQHLSNQQAALEDPNVVGGANSLNNRDPGQAATLYGALWQQRTNAIAAAAAYRPYVDGGPASAEAKASEAESLASRCDQVRQAFRSADGQWGYGQTTVWSKEDDGGGGGGSPPEQPAGTEDTLIDEILDFFGFDDEEEGN